MWEWIFDPPHAERSSFVRSLAHTTSRGQTSEASLADDEPSNIYVDQSGANYLFLLFLLTLRAPRPAVLTFVLDATIAYDSRIKSFNSGAERTDNRSSSAHL